MWSFQCCMFLQTFFFKEIILFLATTLTNTDDCWLNIFLFAKHIMAISRSAFCDTLASDKLKNRTHIKIKDKNFFFSSRVELLKSFNRFFFPTGVSLPALFLSAATQRLLHPRQTIFAQLSSAHKHEGSRRITWCVAHSRAGRPAVYRTAT